MNRAHQRAAVWTSRNPCAVDVSRACARVTRLQRAQGGGCGFARPRRPKVSRREEPLWIKRRTAVGPADGAGTVSSVLGGIAQRLRALSRAAGPGVLLLSRDDAYGIDPLFSDIPPRRGSRRCRCCWRHHRLRGRYGLATGLGFRLLTRSGRVLYVSGSRARAILDTCACERLNPHGLAVVAAMIVGSARSCSLGGAQPHAFDTGRVRSLRPVAYTRMLKTRDAEDTRRLVSLDAGRIAGVVGRLTGFTNGGTRAGRQAAAFSAAGTP